MELPAERQALCVEWRASCPAILPAYIDAVLDLKHLICVRRGEPHLVKTHAEASALCEGLRASEVVILDRAQLLGACRILSSHNESLGMMPIPRRSSLYGLF